MNHQEFIVRLKTENPHNLTPLETYTGAHTKIRIKCNVCDYVWSAYPSNFLHHKTGCPKCAGQVISNDDYIRRLSQINSSIIPIEPYINNSTKVAVQCAICNHIWQPRPADLFVGKGCPNCANKKRGENSRKTDEYFKNEMLTKNPFIDVLDDYVDDKTKVLVRCRTCGHEWSAAPNNLLTGRHCPKCAVIARSESRKKTIEEFLFQMREINSMVEIIDSYDGDSVPIKVRCKQCNHKWKARPSGLLQGTGCPRCARSQSSFMEQYIFWSFACALGEENVLYRDRSIIGTELDIYIPDKKLAVEPGGYYYHKDNLDADYAKIKKCAEVGIRLIIIYDNCKGETPKVGNKDVYYFNYDLKYEQNNRTLREIVAQLFHEYSIALSLTENFWQNVYIKAIEHSKRKNTNQLQSQLNSKGFTNVIVTGEYEGNHKSIAVKCAICDNEWQATPHNLLAGRGCPRCGIKRRAQARSKKVRCIETGEIFNSIAEANKRFHSSHIGDACNKKCELAGGYHWEFYFNDDN